MASYKSERCVAIMNQEISFDPLIKFLQDNMKEELPRIMEEEFDYQSISSFGEPVQCKTRDAGAGQGQTRGLPNVLGQFRHRAQGGDPLRTRESGEPRQASPFREHQGGLHLA